MFYWNKTLAGAIARSICFYGPPQTWAYRECEFSGTRNANFWMKANDTQCNFASKTTKELDSLSKASARFAEPVIFYFILRTVFTFDVRRKITLTLDWSTCVHECRKISILFLNLCLSVCLSVLDHFGAILDTARESWEITMRE